MYKNGPDPYYYVQHRRSTSDGYWNKRKVEVTNATITVDCTLGSDGVLYDFRVFAVNKVTDTEELKGKPTDINQHKMCKAIPGTQ